MRASFKEVKQLDFPAMEQEILSLWKDSNTFQESLESRRDGIPFTFYEGPPTANGKPGIHHVMARTVKDLFCRYRTLKGFRVERKAGWDTHGLPVEIEVEKELGLDGRHQVEAYGVAEYNARCRASVLKYKDLWDDLTTRMGYWVDLENPYITFDNNYIESVWWAIKKLYDSGYLYKGYKIQWYSPGNATVLSSHEVSLGYKEVQDPSVYIKFAVDNEPGTFFLAWTTTPWTLVSNMALAVHPEIVYKKIRLTASGEHLILAESRIADVIKEDFEMVDSFSGKALEGKTYTPLFDFALQKLGKQAAWRVLTAQFVTTADGTGIVHMAPAFGADDYDTCQKNDIPMFNPINKDGKFEPVIAPWAGVWFKEADKGIARDLKDRGLLYRQETYLHNYPHDWRKGTPLMSYPVESWFIRTTAVRERMVDLNKTIGWKPESTGTGRFGTWLENNVDWAISRQRFWGTPLPIWQNESNPDHVEVIGSIEALRAKAGLENATELDLHRPYIDQITWKNADGSVMRRIPDLLDVWFDSGAMPFAQWHYPFENQDKFNENFPGDFIAEGVDQTRGWFYTLHALGVLLFDKVAYRNVVSNGLVLDAKGEKMSKSKGNTVNPFETIAAHGADAVRWYLMSNSAPWENLKFNAKVLEETQRKFFSTLLNTYSFFALYANIDKFDGTATPVPLADRPEIDRWIISRLNSTIKVVDEELDHYEPTKAAREMEQFIEELSNWYVRRSRRRFWKSGTSKDKTSAYQTLLECLLSISKLMSPIAPFFSEWLFQRISEVIAQPQRSVHTSFFPTVNETAIDPVLERRMELARSISSVVLRIRNKVNVNVRQPLGGIILPVHDAEERKTILSVSDIILDEVNVKKLEFVEDESGIVIKTAKPNFPILGKKLGKRMKAAAALIGTFGNAEINLLEKQGFLELNVEGEPYRLVSADVDVLRQGLSGWEVETEGDVTVAADTTITDALLLEGLAREIVNRVQNMRKEAGYDVTDRIKMSYTADGDVARAIATHASYIKQETLTAEISTAPLASGNFERVWDIESHSVTLSILRTS
jgi:isoleucyl-tRNA synthetase